MLIFIPKVATPNPSHLEGVGLGYLLQPGNDQGPHITEIVGAGPDGNGGAVFYWLKEGPQETGYVPDRQTWVPAVADATNNLPAGRYWVGWLKDQLPKPADLQRDNLLPGRLLKLGDDQVWHIPSAMQVPQRMRLQSDGIWKPQADARYQRFVERSQWAFDAVLKVLRGEAGVDLSEMVTYALESLAWNYRIVPELANALDLFPEITLTQVAANTTDVDRLREMVTKAGESEGAQTRSG